ncbi:MAG: 3-deoxy-7-phosphoheptulonate synthase [Pseudomonadota bacterium]
MILVLDNQATNDEIKNLQQRLKFMGFEAIISNENAQKTISLVKGVDKNTDIKGFINLPLVKEILPLKTKFGLANKDAKAQQTVIRIKDKKIGGGHFTVMAGPCAIESRQQILAIAKAVSSNGASILRGGAFKPRTSPYDFQGLGEVGLHYMREAADRYNLLCISEVMNAKDIDLLEKYVDILQIGARNMQNYNLLKAAGQAKKPVFLKRGLSATYNEFLLAAEYILSCGNPNVILCERGIRTFETHSRNTLDIAAVPILRELTHLPIIVDPSHGTGIRNAVAPMANAAMAVCADGIMVEVHTDPDKSVSDAQQAISPTMFADMMRSLRGIAKAVDMTID